MRVPGEIINVNHVLTRVVLDKVKGKKVLLLFTGGRDSRSLFFILLKHHVSFDVCMFTKKHIDSGAYRMDWNIAQYVLRRYGKKNILGDDFYAALTEEECEQQVYSRYDVVINCSFMSGGFDRFSDFHKSVNDLERHLAPWRVYVEKMKKRSPMLFFPALEPCVLQACDEIPIMYRMFSYPQDCITRLNKPNGLLITRRTCFNLRKRCMVLLHRFVMYHFELFDIVLNNRIGGKKNGLVSEGSSAENIPSYDG